jgi:ATP-dependent RNA helicase DbpA
MNDFAVLNLIEPLDRALAEAGYAEMTPVQAASLPAILAGRDAVVQAQTGSGKTAASRSDCLRRWTRRQSGCRAWYCARPANSPTRSAARSAGLPASFPT